MTEEQIVKALECCIDTKSSCAECPYYKGNGNCNMRKLQADALELIKRKEAEL